MPSPTQAQVNAIIYILSLDVPDNVDWQHRAIVQYSMQVYKNQVAYVAVGNLNSTSGKMKAIKGRRSRLLKRASKFTLGEDGLLEIASGMPVLTCEDTMAVLRALHDGQGHPGRNVTREMLRQRYACVDIQMIDNYVAKCEYCRNQKPKFPSHKNFKGGGKKRKIADRENEPAQANIENGTVKFEDVLMETDFAAVQQCPPAAGAVVGGGGSVNGGGHITHHSSPPPVSMVTGGTTTGASTQINHAFIENIQTENRTLRIENEKLLKKNKELQERNLKLQKLLPNLRRLDKFLESQFGHMVSSSPAGGVVNLAPSSATASSPSPSHHQQLSSINSPGAAAAQLRVSCGGPCFPMPMPQVIPTPQLQQQQLAHAPQQQQQQQLAAMHLGQQQQAG